jgi:putative DNA primase/helicase
MDYVSMGWHVFPLAAGSKQPLPKTNGFKDATNDYTTVARWFTNRDHNIAVATGERSGLVILDVDQKHDGYESLGKLVDEIGEGVMCTRIHRTAGGGCHIIYRYPQGLSIGRKINAFKRLNMPGLDVLGNDGYAVLPPSAVTDDNGRERVYTVLDDDPVIDAPAKFYELLARASGPSISGPQGRGDSIAAPARHGTAGIVNWLASVPPGDQDNACSWVARALRDEGLRPEEAADLLWSAMTQMQTSGRPWAESDVRRHIRSAYQR